MEIFLPLEDFFLVFLFEEILVIDEAFVLWSSFYTDPHEWLCSLFF